MLFALQGTPQCAWQVWPSGSSFPMRVSPPPLGALVASCWMLAAYTNKSTTESHWVCFWSIAEIDAFEAFCLPLSSHWRLAGKRLSTVPGLGCLLLSSGRLLSDVVSPTIRKGRPLGLVVLKRILPVLFSVLFDRGWHFEEGEWDWEGRWKESCTLVHLAFLSLLSVTVTLT